MLREIIEFMRKEFEEIQILREIIDDGIELYEVKVRGVISKGSFVDVWLKSLRGEVKQACYLIVKNRPIWGYNNAPHYMELASYPHHEHNFTRPAIPKETSIRNIKEAVKRAKEILNKFK